MLSPRYLDGLSDEIAEIYSQLEADILQDMARRLKKLGKITEATRWQAQMLLEAGGLKKNIARILAKYDAEIVRKITAVFTAAMEVSAKNDNRIFEQSGRTVSAPNAQKMLSTIQKCHSDLARLTLTTAATSETQFVRQANRAYMMTQSGAFSYDAAAKSAADELARRGITAALYENKKPVARTIESAVRMNILASVNQAAANQTLNNCEELGCDLVETSAHRGARPEHAEWQGQIFSLSGKSKKYRAFSVCGLGTAAGICGINCRHSYYPYFEGAEKHYTQKDLDELADEEIDLDGEKMTRYEAEQKLRGIERNVRKYKRLALTEEAAGADSTAARRKLGEWQSAAKDFTQKTGITREYARERIGTPGKQPRGIAPKKEETQRNAAAVTKDEKTARENATEEKLKTLVDNPKSYARELFERYGIESRAVFAYDKQPTEAEIIKRISGGDETEKGSCSSLGFAYIANKEGFDVLDFRGGKSAVTFSSRNVIKEIAGLNGVKSKIVVKYNDFSAAHELYKEMEAEKQYYFAAGKHAAIIQKKDGVLQWLEMQSPDSSDNTWHPLNDDILKRRFACQHSYTRNRQKYMLSSILIDIETLGKNKEFIELMKYINTSESGQMKGARGYIK